MKRSGHIFISLSALKKKMLDYEAKTRKFRLFYFPGVEIQMFLITLKSTSNGAAWIYIITNVYILIVFVIFQGTRNEFPLSLWYHEMFFFIIRIFAHRFTALIFFKVQNIFYMYTENHCVWDFYLPYFTSLFYWYRWSLVDSKGAGRYVRPPP